jgi:hypothetical protein
MDHSSSNIAARAIEVGPGCMSRRDAIVNAGWGNDEKALQALAQHPLGNDLVHFINAAIRSPEVLHALTETHTPGDIVAACRKEESGAFTRAILNGDEEALRWLDQQFEAAGASVMAHCLENPSVIRCAAAQRFLWFFLWKPWSADALRTAGCMDAIAGGAVEESHELARCASYENYRPRGIWGGLIEMLSWLESRDIRVGPEHCELLLKSMAYIGCIDALEWLRERGLATPEILGAGQFGTLEETMLHYAAQAGHVPVINWLLFHGFKGGVQKEAGKYAACAAAQGGHVPALERLLEHGIEMQEAADAMFRAAFNLKTIGALDWMREHGLIKEEQIKSDGVLWWAATHDNTALLEWLFQAGAFTAEECAPYGRLWNLASPSARQWMLLR